MGKKKPTLSLRSHKIVERPTVYLKGKTRNLFIATLGNEITDFVGAINERYIPDVSSV